MLKGYFCNPTTQGCHLYLATTLGLQKIANVRSVFSGDLVLKGDS